jgi:hypothetical protein
MDILVNVQQWKDLPLIRNVVSYHVPNGLLANGPNVPNRAVVELRHEMFHARTTMLVTALSLKNQLQINCVVMYPAPTGLLLHGASVLNHVMGVFRSEMFSVKIVTLVIVQ